MWDGVRNYQARNNLKKMIKIDLCFFYHSVTEKSVVGIVKVVKEHYTDPNDKTGSFVVVDVKAINKLSLEPNECLVVEDNENGIKSALASGAHLLKVKNPDEVTYDLIKSKIAEIQGEI